MTKQEYILEGNKLIALSPFGNLHKDMYNKWFNENNIFVAYNESEFKYHLSYTWLMPAWFKAMTWYTKEFRLMTSTFEISNLGIIIKSTSSNSFKYARTIFNEDNYLNDIFEALVEFIKWYNINK